MTWKQRRTEYENEGVTNLRKILNQGWTVTPTVNPYTTYDATVTKGDMSFKVENKTRTFTWDTYDEIYLAYKKLDPDVTYYVEYFTDGVAAVTTYDKIIKGLNDGTVKKKKVLVPKGQCKYIEGVDNSMEELLNLVIPKSLFVVRRF